MYTNSNFDHCMIKRMLEPLHHKYQQATFDLLAYSDSFWFSELEVTMSEDEARTIVEDSSYQIASGLYDAIFCDPIMFVDLPDDFIFEVGDEDIII